MPMNPNKYTLDIPTQHLHQGDVVLRPPSLHQTSKATVVNNLERSVVFSYTADEFGPAIRFSGCCPTNIKLNIPCFNFHMVAVTIHCPSFTHLLKYCCDWPIDALQILQGGACGFDISRAISCINSLTAPACLGMLLQITGGLRITCI
jgi:hypothetical protein